MSRRPSIFVYSLSTKHHDSPSILLFRLCMIIAVLFLRYLVIVGIAGSLQCLINHSFGCAKCYTINCRCSAKGMQSCEPSNGAKCTEVFTSL